MSKLHFPKLKGLHADALTVSSAADTDPRMSGTACQKHAAADLVQSPLLLGSKQSYTPFQVDRQ